jgi:guanylate kinase
MRSGTLFIISGPSGAGKGTLVNRVRDSITGLEVSVSATTRLPRAGERDGREYHFFSARQFDTELAADGFLEWAEVHGQRYGTLRREVERLLASGRDLILEIDVQGREQVLSRWPEAVSVFVAPPSLEELERRLRARGSDDERSVQWRVRTAREEMKKADSYDYLIFNDDLEKAVHELEGVILAKR